MTQRARTSTSPEGSNPFAFPEWGRLRNDSRRRRRRRLEGVAPVYLVHTPSGPFSSHPAQSRWRSIFGARIPFLARGREPNAPNPRGLSVCRPGLALLARLAHAVVAFLAPSPPATRELPSSLSFRHSSCSQRTSQLPMMVQRQSRFAGVDPVEAQARLKAYKTRAIEKKGNEKPFVAPDTKAERDRIWNAWIEYVVSFSLILLGFVQPIPNLDIKPGTLY